ncbi:MAG: hypothetical protein EBV63_06245 [Actinobacteria bacterium]|nr:hypothetical protein [Actinomycetota bacterium]NCU90261.1 hypothetical protein [Actinomycetota bacterium]NDE55031.1 hypothetical protein [Actinomycetota bacterium]
MGGRDGRTPERLCDVRSVGLRSDDFPSSGLRPEGLRSDGRLEEERELGGDDGRPVALAGRFSILTFLP